MAPSRQQQLQPSAPATDATAEFLRLVFRGQESGFAVVYPLPAQRSEFFDLTDPDWISRATAAAHRLRDTQNVYIGTCSQQEIPPLKNGKRGRGGAVTALAVPGMWADIDILGPQHASPDLPPTAEDALELIRAVPFAPTLIVRSGYGLQPWWLFREPLEIHSEQERQYAAGLAVSFLGYLTAAAKQRGWKVDPTGDLARVLRLPGTFNRKSSDPVLVTYELTPGEPRYNPSEFEEFLSSQAPSDARVPRPAGTSGPADLGADFGLITQGCSWLRHCVRDAATLPEPEWYRALAVAGRCRGGDQIAHEISRAYPKYSASETDRKLAQARTASNAPLCSYIGAHFDSAGQYCGSCPSRGRVNSPVGLGYLKRATSAAAVPARPAAPPAGPPEPPPFEPASEPADADAPPREDPLGELIAIAVEKNDVAAIYRLAPSLARLSVTDWQITRQTLLMHFGKQLGVRGLDAAVKAEKFKHRKQERSQATLPQIVIAGDIPLRDQTAQALEALHSSNQPPHIFQRSGELVRVILDENGRPIVQLISEACLRGLLARAADFLKPTPDGDKHIAPPIEIVRDLSSQPPEKLSFPPLAGVVEVPTLRPDGTVLTERGYDPQSGLYYAPQEDLNLPAVPDEPSSKELEDAIELLGGAIGDFPFDSSFSSANTLALLLTSIVRPALNGCVPLALIDAPQAGTGKSLLVRLFSVISTGRDAAMMPFPKNDEEMGKQIASSLMAGRPLVCFDNFEGTLSSPALALALTAREYETRILGVSENMLVPNNAVWLVTGNNIKPAGDMPRRCYHIRLDARMTTPYRGRSFKYPDLIGWATKNRGRLLHALLTIARAWYACDRPQLVSDPLGSFENWHRTVGSILANARIRGFLGNLDSFLATADESVAEWELFLDKLYEQYGRRTFTAARVKTDIDKFEALRKAVPTKVEERMELKKTAGTVSRVIASAFSARRDIRFGEAGIYVSRVAADSHSKASLWCVLKGEEKPDLDTPPADDTPV